MRKYMDINYIVTQESLIHGMSLALRKFSKGGKATIIAFTMIGFGLMCISLQLIWNITSECSPLFSANYFNILFSQNYSKLFIIVATFAGGIAFFVNAYKFPKGYFKKWAKKPMNQSAFGDKNITLDNNQITISSNQGNRSNITWQTISRIFQTQQFFFFEVQENNFIIIPKNAITHEEIRYIDETIKQNAQSRYQIMNY